MFILLVLGGRCLVAQSEYLTFEHFTYEQGLSSPVTLIAQDHYGFLWLGTRDGLNRFDGRNFIVFRNIPGDASSLPNNIINSIFIDSRNRIWVATNGGLAYYDFADDVFHPVEYDVTQEKLDRHRVHAVAEGTDHSIWFATRTILHQWNEDGNVTSYPLSTPGDLLIKHLFIDQHDRKWIGYNDGILVFDHRTNKTIDGRLQSEFTSANKLPITVHPIRHYQGDTLLTGSWYAGLQKVFITGDTVLGISFPDDSHADLRRHIVTGMAKGNDAWWWIGTYGSGLSWWDSSTGRFTQHFMHNPSDAKSLSDNYINDVFRDASGIIWIGTAKGLDKFDPLTQQFKSVAIPLSSQQFSVYRLANTIVEDKHNPDWLWLCVSGAGLYHYNRKSGEFRLYRIDDRSSAQIANNFYCFYYDHLDRIWIGSRTGLHFFNPKMGTFHPAPLKGDRNVEGVHTIAQDRQKRFWMGTLSSGVYCYDEQLNELTAYRYEEGNDNSLRDNKVFCLLVDRSDKIWIGTQNRGLARYDPVTKKFTFFEHDKKDSGSLADNGIYDLYEDEQHQLWLGTESGFSRMNLKDLTFHNYYTRDGLSNNTVFSITADNKRNLWLGTNNGLSQFDPHIERFRNYYSNDGLPNNRIDGEVVYTSDHTLCLGTPGMITFCQPDKMKTNMHVPMVVITDISILGKKTQAMRTNEMLQPIHLSHKQNMITFNFAALSFTNAFLNRYAYKMEGFDDDWRDAGNNQTATYTNLNGGTYTFRVKAANNDGTWNHEGTYATVIVHPPFWRTWWFYALCALGLGTILYTYYRIRINQLIRLQNIRTRIARDLHDDIGSTLSSINIISSMADRVSPSETKSSELFHTISNASGQAMDLMSDIVWSINPGNDKLEMIIIRMRQYASEILEAAGIDFVIEMNEADKNILLPLEIRKDFFLIFKEAINNLAKYSRATKAIIRLKFTHHVIHLYIEDNGVGFDPDQVHSGNGLKNMKSRAMQMKSHMILSSKPGEGTRIELSVPLTP
jgi:ligand-binding sensor domain-containing protein/two-component sensor histidine kinase